MKIVPDTSVIIDGRVTSKIKDGEIRGTEVIISEAVLGELEAQANRGQETGLNGLEEIQMLKKMEDKDDIILRFAGERPSLNQIKLASSGEIDSIIRELAIKEDAILMTSDIVQAEVGKAKGIKVEYLEPEKDEKAESIELRRFFEIEENIMSVHLREGFKAKGKVGMPGEIKMKEIGEDVLTKDDLKNLARDIIERAKRSSDGFIEFDKGGATVVQLRDIRISIARPPFSDGMEITAVRPVAKVSLEDYRLSDELKSRLSEKHRGVLVAGSPGAGKSTLAQAIAEHLLSKGFVVKTMEDPRDLQVTDEITQYTSLENKIEDTADLLLLVRPDYTIYDEVRKSSDFKVFADMRLAGVGMVGVTHANRGIDALQRLIGRVELGIIPQIVDTIVFLDEAKIANVYNIEFNVKVPAGMSDQDLARPVIEVKNLESGKCEYEVYTYGEQVVVMPIEDEGKDKKPIWSLAQEEVRREINKYVRGGVKVSISSNDSATVYVPEDQIAPLLGRGGQNITSIEEKLGIKIDVQPLNESTKSDFSKKYTKFEGEQVDVTVGSSQVILNLGMDKAGKTLDLYSNDEYLLTATVGQDGSIKIKKSTSVAQKIIKNVRRDEEIRYSGT